MSTRTQSVVAALAAAIFAAPLPAEAIPVFAHRYSLSCQACHTTVPHLTPFGETFMANGYRLSRPEAQARVSGCPPDRDGLFQRPELRPGRRAAPQGHRRRGRAADRRLAGGTRFLLGGVVPGRRRHGRPRARSLARLPCDARRRAYAGDVAGRAVHAAAAARSRDVSRDGEPTRDLGADRGRQPIQLLQDKGRRADRVRQPRARPRRIGVDPARARPRVGACGARSRHDGRAAGAAWATSR